MGDGERDKDQLQDDYNVVVFAAGRGLSSSRTKNASNTTSTQYDKSVRKAWASQVMRRTWIVDRTSTDQPPSPVY